MDYRKITFWKLVLLAFLLNIITQAIHEGGHWLVYELSGLKPVWGFTSLVQVWDESPLHPEEWLETTSLDGEQGWLKLGTAPTKTQDIIGLAAGPLAGLLGAALGLRLVFLKSKPATKQMGLVLALSSSFLMSQYYLRGGGGDEYFLAAHLGISERIIAIPFEVAFITVFILGFRALGEWRIRGKWLGAILLGSIPAGLFLMSANNFVQSQVNQGSPFFQPLLGFSLPVIAINLLTFLALWVLWKRDSAHLEEFIK